MVSSKDNKVVDYGGTAGGVIGILLCFCFYPALVLAAYGGTWFAENFFELKSDKIIVQAVFFVIGIIIISTLTSFVKYSQVFLVMLITIYLMTLPFAWELLKSCYN
jgi:glucose-6-phosphate-specific signal transduction histidine kinase